jgi:hypothetical protein
MDFLSLSDKVVDGVRDNLGRIAVIVSVAATAGGGAFGIYSAGSAYRDGIYASMHFNDAQNAAISVMAKSYGRDVLAGMRFANPNVVNTHLQVFKQPWTKTDNVQDLADNGQVRVFHILGRRGVKYCTGVWDSGFGHQSPHVKYFVTKGCKF